MGTCGPADDMGYCRERFHAPGCGSAATPDVIEGLRADGVFQRKAMSPLADARGLVWRDQQHDSPMTATNHIEAASGVRLGDASPDAPGPHRELIQPARPPVFSDVGDPDDLGHGVPSSTRATVAAALAGSGIRTHADAQAQHAAFRAERERQAARYRPPRHMDYQEHASPARKAVELSQIGKPWNGSLPQYSASGAMPDLEDVSW